MARYRYSQIGNSFSLLSSDATTTTTTTFTNTNTTTDAAAGGGLSAATAAATAAPGTRRLAERQRDPSTSAARNGSNERENSLSFQNKPTDCVTITTRYQAKQQVVGLQTKSTRAGNESEWPPFCVQIAAFEAACLCLPTSAAFIAPCSPSSPSSSSSSSSSSFWSWSLALRPLASSACLSMRLSIYRSD